MDSVLPTVVAELVKLSASGFGTWVSQRQNLKKALGEWMDEAHADGNRCMIPVLEQAQFEAYLKNCNGVFKPSGTCRANSRWAYLLHALGIRPGMGILSWKPQFERGQDSQMLHISLEMTGATLSHIINLCGVDVVPYDLCSWQTVPQNPTQRLMQFGNLSMQREVKEVTATFNPGSVNRINEMKVSLGKAGLRFHGVHKSKLIQAYFYAMKYGISDSKLRWPSAKSPLVDRVRKLLEVTHVDPNDIDDCVLNATKPLLITHGWLKMASRIRRRVFCGGPEENHFLLDDIITTIENDPEIDVTMKNSYKSGAELSFCFKEEGYRFGYGDIDESAGEVGRGEIFPILSRTLKSYATERQGSRKHELYLMNEEVLQLWWLPRNIRLNTEMRILDYGETDDLWKQTVTMVP